MAGLVQFTTNAEIAAKERQENEQREAARLKRDGFESSLAAHIRRAWHRNFEAKWSIEQRMLDALRARNGEYDPETLAEIRKTGGSGIFMMLTAVKCRAAKAWIRDIMMPAADKAWGLQPTPIPDVPKKYLHMIRKRAHAEIQQMARSGQKITPDAMIQIEEKLKQRLKQAAEDRAKKACEKHETLIEDQLTEAGYRKQMDAFLDDFVTFPAAVLKGPTKRRHHTFRWGRGMRPIRSTAIGTEVRRVSPFDVYPAPDAETCDDGEFIERLHLSPRDLYACKGLPGYNSEAIDQVIRQHGQDGLRDWLWGDFERAKLEDKDRAWMSGKSSTIDGLHYWGPAQGLLLLQWGVPVEYIQDPLEFYEIEAILIKNWVVRCKINNDPLERRPYQKSCFQEKPGSFWGMSIPELMADIQRVCNATARSLVNNMALGSGPMAEVATDRLAEGEDGVGMYPYRVFYTKDSPTGQNNPAIRFFQPNINASELIGVYEKFELKADDATNVPRYAYGNEHLGGAARTASGLSMLLESASKGIKEAIANIDMDVTRPLIEKMWFSNMLHSEDDAIKGDAKVVACGASVLVAKDSAVARHLEMLQLTNNPVDMRIMGMERRAKLLRYLFRQAGIEEDIMPSVEEIQQRMAQEAKQKSPEEREQDREDAKLKLEAHKEERETAETQSEIRTEQGELALKARDQTLEEAKFRHERRQPPPARDERRIGLAT